MSIALDTNPARATTAAFTCPKLASTAYRPQ
jgi:hypothetical protein